MDHEDTINAAHAAAASEPSQMPLPSEAAESAQTLDVVHAAATSEPSQFPSPSEAAASAHDDSSTLISSSDSLASSTESVDTGKHASLSHVQALTMDTCRASSRS